MLTLSYDFWYFLFNGAKKEKKGRNMEIIHKIIFQKLTF